METNLKNKTNDKKVKKMLLVSGGVVVVLGLTGVILYKIKCKEDASEELELLTDVALEAGIFDAAISNISRRLDIKRCEYSRYLEGGNLNQIKVEGYEKAIDKFEKMLEYAIKKKATMIQVDE